MELTRENLIAILTPHVTRAYEVAAFGKEWESLGRVLPTHSKKDAVKMMGKIELIEELTIAFDLDRGIS